MADTTTRTRHRRFAAVIHTDCSRRGCDRGTKPNEFAWHVTGDINYDALCDTCHDREFPAIHYAICSQDGGR